LLLVGGAGNQVVMDGLLKGPVLQFQLLEILGDGGLEFLRS
jgi:hypothetical protein